MKFTQGYRGVDGILYGQPTDKEDHYFSNFTATTVNLLTKHFKHVARCHWRRDVCRTFSAASGRALSLNPLASDLIFRDCSKLYGIIFRRFFLFPKFFFYQRLRDCVMFILQSDHLYGIKCRQI